jgi:hypothetical protein
LPHPPKKNKKTQTNFMHGLKSAILAIFLKRLGWLCPVSATLKKVIMVFEKLILFRVPMNISKDWKAKLESVYSSMLKYSKITV